MTNELYDLDALVPEAKKIKLNGKILTCNIPTIKQLIDVARLKDSLINIKEVELDSYMDKIKEVLVPIIPEIADDKDFKLKPIQLPNILQYIQDISSEKRELPDDLSPKKKVA